MDDIDQLLEDLRSATNVKAPIKKQTSSSSSTSSLYKRFNSNESANNSRLSNQIINENELFDSNENKSEISELDKLLNDLNQAKKSDRLSSSSTSPLKSVDSESRTNRSSGNNGINIQPEAAAKELDDLMNSLSAYKIDPLKQNTNSTFLNNNNLCSGCGELITGQVITALGSLWHPAHFICYFCNNTIGTSIFYEKDGRPYCENDYLNLFSPKCANCSQPILDKMLTALNKTWHPDCFTCSSCNKLLNDESFLEKNNNAFCKECYTNKLAPQCLHCQQPIIDNFISAMNAYWHENCFVCTECGIPFNTSSFFEYNGFPYCELHYHYKRGSLCSNCQKPINGRCITAMNKKFHPEHFICSFCTKQLNKGTFKEQNDKPYCHPCFFKLFPQ